MISLEGLVILEGFEGFCTKKAHVNCSRVDFMRKPSKPTNPLKPSKNGCNVKLYLSVCDCGRHQAEVRPAVTTFVAGLGHLPRPGVAHNQPELAGMRAI